MPLACVMTDPFVFTRMEDDFRADPLITNPEQLSRITPLSAASYALILWQMTVLCGSWFLSPGHPRIASLLAGNLLIGILFAAAIAAVLSPFAVLMSAVLVGLPGLTPWFTMAAYASAYTYCIRVASPGIESWARFVLVIIGAAMSTALPLATIVGWKLMH